MDEIMYDITDEMVEEELAILREHTLTDEEELQRQADLDELDQQLQAESEWDDQEELFYRMMWEEGDTIDNLGLRGYFGP